MKLLLRTIFFGTLILFFTSCTSKHEIRGNYHPKRLQSKEGIVLMSLTHSGTFNKAPRCRYKGLTYDKTGITVDEIPSKAKKDEPKTIEDEALIFGPATEGAEGESTILGRVTAIKLRAGTYEITHCEVKDQWEPEKEAHGPAVRFIVVPRRTLYVGELNIDTQTSPVTYTVQDNWRRDAAYFATNWPNLNLSEVMTMLLKTKKALP